MNQKYSVLFVLEISGKTKALLEIERKKITVIRSCLGHWIVCDNKMLVFSMYLSKAIERAIVRTMKNSS